MQFKYCFAWKELTETYKKKRHMSNTGGYYSCSASYIANLYIFPIFYDAVNLTNGKNVAQWFNI